MMRLKFVKNLAFFELFCPFQSIKISFQFVEFKEKPLSVLADFHQWGEGCQL